MGPATDVAAAAARLLAEIDATGRGPRGLTRAPWSPELAAAESVVIAAGAAAGLDASHDPAGNLWLTDPAAPAARLVGCGSHLDTVPDAGALDGALGVASALAAVASLRSRGVAGAARLAVVAFADEEGWRFGTPIFGSRSLVGSYGPEVLDRRDADGVRLGDVCPSDPASARGGHRRLAAFLELHVEQGLGLAPQGAALGVCTRLAARGRYSFRVDGHADHAGTAPMEGRHDALVRAAVFVLAVDEAARSTPGARATIGQLAVEPGGSNSVPGRVTGTLDARAPDAGARDALVLGLAADFPDVDLEPLALDDGVDFDPGLRAILHAAAAEAGATAVDLPSYAGHDAGVLASDGIPAAMVFVRSTTGVSHHPDEDAAAADRALGAVALERALERVLARDV